MKNYLILAMILIAGLTAYPQATRSARESRSEKGSDKKETTQRSVSRSDSKSKSERKVNSTAPERNRSASRSTNVDRSKSSPAQSEGTRSRVETRSAGRESSNRSNNEAARSINESRRGNNEATRSAQEQSRVRTGSNERNESGNAVRRQEPVATRSENRTATGSGSSRNIRESRNSDNRSGNNNSSSASRVYREGRGTFTRDDGKVFRHQNDEVFASRRYNLNYENYDNLRRSDEFRRDYRDYDNWYHRRHIRVVHHYHNRYIPVPWDVRRIRYYNRIPRHYDLIWTPLLFHRFMFYYPTHTNWEMEFGSRIETISAYEAASYAGTVRRVYGKVDEVFYSSEDENYILYIGAPFPYHDISIVIPRHIARDISMSPKWYFGNEYVWVVGLINMWEGKPEIIVRDEDQVRRY